MPALRLSPALLMIGMLSAVVPASAQPGWGAPGWDRASRSDWNAPRLSSGRDDREGKVDADQFVADDAAGQLGHGPIAVAAIEGDGNDARQSAIYEAAMVDQLVKAGYDTMRPDPAGGQVAEIRVIRDVLVPEERKRKPVSGEMTVGTSNRGSMVGMAVGIDLTKPRKALVSTRLEARVRDRATGRPLWEGRATIATREGDGHWDDQAIARSLAAALFAKFPVDRSRPLANP